MAFGDAGHRELISPFLDALDGKAPLAVDMSDLIETRELIDAMTGSHSSR